MNTTTVFDCTRTVFVLCLLFMYVLLPLYNVDQILSIAIDLSCSGLYINVLLIWFALSIQSLLCLYKSLIHVWVFVNPTIILYVHCV